MVLGLKICGDSVEDCDVAFDSTFKPVPIPVLLGVPLAYKHVDGDASIEKASSDVVSCLMSNPEDKAVSKEGDETEAKASASRPVQLVRKDKLPFTQVDCRVLNGYIKQWAEMSAELSEMSAEWSAISARFLQPEAFRKYVMKQSGGDASLAFLSLRYPVGSIVRASGLSRPELNEIEGRVAQYTRDRVGVKFQEGTVAIKPERLAVINIAKVKYSHEQDSDDDDEDDETEDEEDEEKTDALAGGELKSGGEPVTKEQELGCDEGGRAGGYNVVASCSRAAEQQGRHLAKSFVESVLNDVKPLDAERGFWGLAAIGEDHHSLNDVVMSAWTGLVRYGLVAEDVLAKAVMRGKVKHLFEGHCRSVAQHGFPISTGVKLGVGNTTEGLLSCIERLAFSNFHNMEWETVD